MEDLIRLGQEAFVLAVMLCLPAAAAALLVGVVTSALQSATNVHDPALSHMPRLVTVALVIAVTASWMGSQVLAFAERAWGG